MIKIAIGTAIGITLGFFMILGIINISCKISDKIEKRKIKHVENNRTNCGNSNSDFDS